MRPAGSFAAALRARQNLLRWGQEGETRRQGDKENRFEACVSLSPLLLVSLFFPQLCRGRGRPGSLHWRITRSHLADRYFIEADGLHRRFLENRVHDVLDSPRMLLRLGSASSSFEVARMAAMISCRSRYSSIFIWRLISATR